MTDKQKVIVSLTLALETCTAALISLSSSQQNISGPDIPILRKDLKSLLSLVHSCTTKCALALKPSQPTYTAALTPVHDLSTHTAALTHCAQLFDVDVHGATITKEAIATVKNVIEAIRALIQTFLALQIDAGSGTGKAGEEYMVRTGTVHDIINKAKGANGLSEDNLGAVRKKWTENRGALEDGFREVGEMVEEAEEMDGGDDGDDGGWEELGLGKGAKMNVDELERTKKVHALLRLTTLLHKRILLDLLAASSPVSPGITTIPNTKFDTLLDSSTALLTASDDLVSTLYTPQDPSTIRTELVAFIDVVKSLQSKLLVFFPIETQLSEMNIGLEEKTATANGNAKKGGRKWFDTCFEQIYKLSATFASTLDGHNTDHAP